MFICCFFFVFILVLDLPAPSFSCAGWGRQSDSGCPRSMRLVILLAATSTRSCVTCHTATPWNDVILLFSSVRGTLFVHIVLRPGPLVRPWSFCCIIFLHVWAGSTLTGVVDSRFAWQVTIATTASRLCAVRTQGNCKMMYCCSSYISIIRIVPRVLDQGLRLHVLT